MVYLSMSISDPYTVLQQETKNPYRIFRAEVVAINTDEATGRKLIEVKEYGTINEPPYIEAMPPSFLPINSAGSGVQSMPQTGDNCLILEGVGGGSDLSRAQILTYLPNRYVPNEGGLIPEALDTGDFHLKIGGRLKTLFSMSKNGLMQLSGGMFAHLSIDAQLKKITQSSKRYRRKNTIGLYENEFVEASSIDPTSMTRTSHYSSFTIKPETPMESDTKLDTEEAAVVPNIRPYINKTVIRAGKIINTAAALEDVSSHTYTIDTRNSSGPLSTVKDAVTKLELGYQGGHYAYGSSDYRAAGNLIH